MRKIFEMVLLAVSQRWPVLLYGTMGAGKSALIKKLAHDNGNRVLSIHMDEQIDGKTLIGSYVCSEQPSEFRWQPGSLTQGETDVPETANESKEKDAATASKENLNSKSYLGTKKNASDGKPPLHPTCSRCTYAGELGNQFGRNAWAASGIVPVCRVKIKCSKAEPLSQVITILLLLLQLT